MAVIPLVSVTDGPKQRWFVQNMALSYAWFSPGKGQRRKACASTTSTWPTALRAPAMQMQKLESTSED